MDALAQLAQQGSRADEVYGPHMSTYRRGVFVAALLCYTTNLALFDQTHRLANAYRPVRWYMPTPQPAAALSLP